MNERIGKPINSDIYGVLRNRRGPKVEPCGTPQTIPYEIKNFLSNLILRLK